MLINGKYTKKFEVHYYEINKFCEAEPVAILNYLEESAISHSEFAGYGIDRLKAEGIGWVLNHWFVNIERYPLWNQKITVETWPSNFERFYATREFLIKDSNKNNIGRATSLWIFLNMQKKKPLRIPEQFGQAYGVNPERAVEKSFEELCQVGKPEISKEFYIRKSDIDTNNHVNNTKYLEGIMEVIPQETNEEFMLSSFEIKYKKEITYGSSIYFSSQSIIKNDCKHEYIHSILDSENCQLASGRTVWIKRS